MDERKKSEKEAREDEFAKFRVQVKNEKDDRNAERKNETLENIKKFLDNYEKLKSIYEEDKIIDFLTPDQKNSLDTAKSEITNANNKSVLEKLKNFFGNNKKEDENKYESLKRELCISKTKELIDGINKALLGLKENGTSKSVWMSGKTGKMGEYISIEKLIEIVDNDYNNLSNEISRKPEGEEKERLELFHKISEQLINVTTDIGERVKDDEKKEENYYQNLEDKKRIELGFLEESDTRIFSAEETTKGTSLQILAYNALNRTIDSEEVNQFEYRKQVDKEKNK